MGLLIFLCGILAVDSFLRSHNAFDCSVKCNIFLVLVNIFHLLPQGKTFSIMIFRWFYCLKSCEYLVKTEITYDFVWKIE
ncbi:hypothetical protein AQUCO_08700018v1 [Aquilegia coerulea]|uniref:Uncharacterized protein n=1 Tax=Aquilegia coerulea TaxID=218851 RepID=A0A2G5C6D4_AQUCA|nr:hypothetical protein AQUCO_08700018v1 [Aquilegia coerulea]